MDYADYQHLTFDCRPSGVVLVTINRPEVMNATNARLHWELTQVWLTVVVRVVLSEYLAREVVWTDAWERA